ncbi:PEP-CTERM sorting domain-containing protein [Alteromonas stellipolaris]|uniref:PEP-CTERM sorting domain-containing protein n=1 Tax=Alteromonas stellipolaris TaxID=233316 RepID=UPI0026E2DF80|nr:PEP-CTERM sorting domain-containing protein [Alteromonas stellipolaris]MDO6539764.1 PEP-CTERM sorting domain-containing protein [Alteromonas stellipolaris]
MRTKFLQALMVVFLVSSAFQAKAAIISVEGVEVEALSINTSFESFYNFTDWSANTGYEIANELVAFFVTDASDALGLFMIFSGPGGDAGSVNFDLLSSEGSVVFVDDPDGRDPIVGTNVSFGYAADKTDGLVFSEFVSDSWFIDVVFNSVSGVSGFNFLTFDANGVADIATSGSLSDFSISSASAPSAPVGVPAPSSLLILLLSLTCIVLSKRKFF